MTEPSPVSQFAIDRASAMVVTELAGTDSRMARLSEDLIDLLISKGIITEEDFPHGLSLIKDRKALRVKLAAVQQGDLSVMESPDSDPEEEPVP